jgi:hypothetical protein
VTPWLAKVPAVVKGAAVALVLLVGSFYGGCRAQASHDRAVQEKALNAADSMRDSLNAAHQQTVDSLAAEDAKVVAAAKIITAENERLRGIAAGHASSDRRRDTALAHARTAADSLPIVVAQRDDARLSYLTLAVADSSARVNADKELTRRLGLAEQHRLTDSTTAAAREKALREDVKGIALRLDQALHAKKLFGLIPLSCAVGYGVVAAPSTPIKVNHGAGVLCGIRILL